MRERLDKNLNGQAVIDMIEQMRKCDLVQSGKYTEKEVEEHPKLWKSRFNKEGDHK